MTPLSSFMGFENVHREDPPKEDSQEGFTSVTPVYFNCTLQSEMNTTSLPFSHTRDVRTTSRKTTYSGGGLPIRAEDGWMKTSSAMPMAL